MTTDNFDGDSDAKDKTDIDVLHEIGSRIAAADPFHGVLGRVVDFVASVVPCDSCFVYVLEEDDLVLRASKTPHPDVIDRLKMRVGQGITGWVAEHRQPVAVGRNAFRESACEDRADLRRSSCSWMRRRCAREEKSPCR